MQKLRERLKDQKGFTLVEMLIVVAIIAILIAVSFPMVTKSLEKARHAVDDANLRDAVALANIEILLNADEATTLSGKTLYYHVNDERQGELTDTKTGAEESKCTGSGTDDCGNASSTKKYKSGCVIEVSFTSNTEFTASWVDKT